MKSTTMTVTVKVDMIKVFSNQTPFQGIGSVSMFEVPPGLIRMDYDHLQIEVEIKGGEIKYEESSSMSSMPQKADLH